MSMVYCHKHDRMFDSEVSEHCPVCETEPQYAIRLSEDQILSRRDQTPYLFESLKEATFFANKYHGATVEEYYDEE